MRKVVFAFVGALAAIFAAASFPTARSDETESGNLLEQILRAIADEVTKEDSQDGAAKRNPDIPDAIYQLAGKIDGAVDLDLVKKPGEFTGSNFVARVVFEPLRPGYRACADHYPSYFVKEGASCPSVGNNDPPASGWMSCHGAFYTHEKLGCPPQPQTPTAPATTPRPRCDFGPEACKKEAPGGPVLFRILQTATVSGVTLPAPAPGQARVAAHAEVLQPPPAAAQAPAAQVRPADRAVALERAQVSPAVTGAVRTRLQLRDQLKIKPELLCQGGKCQWGGNDAPLTLPAPPVTPLRHAPCEYEHVSFFVPENRYCPKEQLGERPVAGASLYVSWHAEKPASPDLYYHRDDFDGVIRYLMQILGGSDDRYAISEATDREKAAARATAMLIKSEYVSAPEAGVVTLGDDPAWRPLCSNERFSGLPQPGRCSGVKIGDRLVATSAHCIRNQRQCSETAVVFGYYGASTTAASRTVPSGTVYQCESIVASRRPASIGERGADWTIFEVDREIDAPSAALAESADVRPSVVTTVIGHPMGLPAVVTRLGVVQTTTTEYFIANSDTFVGNSGSAVFAAQSVEDDSPRVLGLLTGGGYDFEDSMEDGEECVQAKWCNGPECLGDDVVYTDDLIAALATYAPDP
jgi:V8-like Glu-specific endopeptidase